MAVKNFFSGIEGKAHFQACVDAKVEHVLTSYWQMREKNRYDMVEVRKKLHPDMEFMVDSGAHTFITDWRKFKDWTREDFEKYLKAYVAWIRANKDHIFAAVEFDIDYTLNMVLTGDENSTLGTSIVEEWQKKYFMPLEQEGVTIIYVWHAERGIEGFEDMCAKFSYVGLPGPMSSQKDFNKYMSIAKRHMTRVHGFAATKLQDFRDVEWYSIDSTTWKSGEMYGVILHWDVKKEDLIYDHDKKGRRKYMEFFRKAGVDGEAICSQQSYREVTKFDIWSISEMEKFYERKFARRRFYYDFRLPHPLFVRKSMHKSVVKAWRDRLVGVGLFDGHSNDKISQWRKYLTGIAALQSRNAAFVKSSADVLAFLREYIPPIEALIQSGDIGALQKEMAAYLSPKNQAALERLSPELYEPTQHEAKERELPEDWDHEPDYMEILR